MALPLGKLTVLIGAGLVGSVLAKEGAYQLSRAWSSGAFKIVFKQLKQEEPSKSPPNDTALVAQVNSLRHELQLLASNRPITIVTTQGSGSLEKYGVIIIIGVIGYGYVWWKGWKLPDFMFATRRSLSDAYDNVGNQIDGFYSSLSDTKRELGAEVDRMDCTLDASSIIIKETGRQVTELRDGTASMKDEVRSVLRLLQLCKVYRIEGNQETLSLPPPASPRESQSSPSTPNGAQKSHGPLLHTQSMSGLKDITESSSTGNGVSGLSSGQLGRFSVPRIVRTVNPVPTN
ncbi:hypothetical protein Bca52824_064203 [Brassica carinata]|uniref:DUF1664 domain-containing protein n=1 Tax=Brassica carinata TaxID=52824 RepID=A0A8X7QH06_BRACI|nr:hypothetical protein Bca52824_064203 [Brassica carinata]